ncbi:MAG: hypothetical protein NTZ53_11395 [Cyanobacteria bacterium]|nr:hypothetical protein [Cyanobacteriota bacterium]
MGFREELESGREAFGHLIRVWHERNGWSQRVLPALAERLDLGRVHNSQLSMLRNHKLLSPGPELFLTLGRLNAVLADQGGGRGQGPGIGAELASQLQDQAELLAPLQASALALRTDNGQALGPTELFEIFVGLRQPPAAFDLRIAETESASLSAALAELFTAGRSWRHCRESVLLAYPVEKRQRRERFAEVMAGQREFTAAELDAELPDLRRTLALLGVAAEQALGADQFLELLRQKARLLEQSGREGDTEALAEAIRRGLRVERPEG